MGAEQERRDQSLLIRRGRQAVAPAWLCTHPVEVVIGLAVLGVAVYILALAPRPATPLAVPAGAYLSQVKPLRQFMLANMSRWPIVVPVVGAFAIAGLLLGRRERGQRPALLLGVLALAAEGQLFVLQQQTAPGIALYVLAAVGFAAWAWMARDRWEAGPLAPVSWSWRREAFLVLLVLAVTAFTRFYLLGQVPYGVQGDEAKWTMGVVNTMIEGKDETPYIYKFTDVPTSLVMEAPFFRLLGISLWTGRVAVAFYSFASVAVFYLLARTILNVPLALVATFLLSVSLMHLSGGRIGMVEGQVTFWSVLAPALAVAGWMRRQSWLFLAAGVALALGLLTFDTYAPMLAVVGLFVAVKAWGERAEWRRWRHHLAALALPLLLAAPTVIGFMCKRTFEYARPYGGFERGPLAALAQGFSALMRNFYVTRGDFFLNRAGPMLNSLLIPFLLLGLVYVIIHIRQRNYALPAAWFLLTFLPAPVILQQPAVRVFFAGVPAFYVLIAIPLWGLAWELGQLWGPRWRPVLAGVLVAGLATFGLLNFYIYLNEVEDPVERQARRELSELIPATIGPDRLVYGPYTTPNESPILYGDAALWNFLMRDKVPPGSETRYLALVPINAVMADLRSRAKQYEQVIILYDRQPMNRVPWEKFRADLVRCYPGLSITTGRYYDLYTISRTELNESPCR